MSKIASCAFFYDGMIFSKPRPNRHVDIMATLRDLGMEHIAEIGTQGFLTDAGMFVRREPARRIAELAGQIRGESISSRQLFSEDLW